MFQFLADLVLVLHLGVVVFVVGGLVLIVAGNLLGWLWVNGIAFRLLHLGAIGIVVLESWLGVTCPLTTLESWLRTQAGVTAHGQGFIQYWVQRVPFYEAPPAVFTLVYTVFGTAVAAVWWVFPPRRRKPRLP